MDKKLENKAKLTDCLLSETISIKLESCSIKYKPSDYIIARFSLFGLNTYEPLKIYTISELDSSSQATLIYEKTFYNLNPKMEILTFNFDKNDLKINPKSSKINHLYFHLCLNYDQFYYFVFSSLESINSGKSYSYSFSLNSSNEKHTKLTKLKPQNVEDLIWNFQNNINSNVIKFRIESKYKPVQISMENDSDLEIIKIVSKKENIPEISYQFKNYTNIQTYSSKLKCIFCHLNLNNWNCLIDHMKNVHFRFLYKEITSSFNLEIRLDETFDGSYWCGLMDLKKAEHLGHAQSRVRPVKKKFQHLFTKFRKSRTHFQSDRVYFHSKTNMPINGCESDSDTEPEWLREQGVILLNEFADVNQGEKDLMHLWNSHVSKYNFLADSNIYLACETFINEQIDYLVRLNLVKNFLLHLSNLFDHGLVNAQGLLKLVNFIDSKHKIC